jgi:hypothetical protein
MIWVAKMRQQATEFFEKFYIELWGSGALKELDF